MFETLSERLTSALGTLTGKGRLTEQDIEAALRQVRMALLEADVDFKVARNFVSKIREEAQGENVVRSLTPGQTVVKIVQDNLVEVLGGESAALQRGETPPSVIMLVGLQGAGKTTAAAKLALHIRRERKQDAMIAACDLQRPAAVEQLVTLGKQINVPVYNEDARKSTPLKVAKNALDRAKRDGTRWLILDTAGRLAIDDELMGELETIKSTVDPIETFLVVDAMTGQDAVNSGSEFNRRIGLTGYVADEDGWRCSRRCGAFDEVGYGTAGQVRRCRRASGAAGGVSPGADGAADIGHGRCHDTHREGAAGDRRGRCEAVGTADAAKRVRLERHARAVPIDTPNGSVVGCFGDDTWYQRIDGRSQFAKRRRKADVSGGGDHTVNDSARAVESEVVERITAATSGHRFWHIAIAGQSAIGPVSSDAEDDEAHQRARRRARNAEHDAGNGLGVATSGGCCGCGLVVCRADRCWYRNPLQSRNNRNVL